MPTAPPPARETKIDAQVFWFKYHKEILGIIGLVIIAAIAFASYRFYSDRTEAAASAALAKAKTPADYQHVIAQYPSTAPGASAYLLLAQAQRNERKFAESNATLQAFVQKHPKHPLVPAARVAMAANFESLGRNDDALSMYQQVSNNSPQSFEAPYAMVAQVRLLKAKNQTEPARQICEKILTEHSDSRWAGEAMRELRELTPKEPAAPAGPPGNAARSTSSPGQGAPGAPPMIARPPSAPAPSAAPQPK